MAILTMMRHRFYKNDGTPNALGKVYTYEAGTSTPVTTYTSSSASVANANPIILDAKGEADIWVVGQIKVNVLESDDTQVTGWPVDNIGSGVSNNDATARWGGTAGGTANALTITPSPSISEYVAGQSFVFKSGASPNTTATTISISGLATIALQSNGAACSGGEILANMYYAILLNSTTTCQVVKIGEPTLAELGAAALAGSSSQAFSTAALTTTGLFDISGAAAGQVKFPATQNASSNANTLDDYEESTWTPFLTFATPGDLNVIYSAQTGTYTKIGNKVFADVFISTSTFTHTTASGQLRITGLPFAAGSATYNNLNYGGITKVGYSVVTATTGAASTILSIEACGSGVPFAAVTPADCPTGGIMVLRGQVVYIV